MQIMRFRDSDGLMVMNDWFAGQVYKNKGVEGLIQTAVDILMMCMLCSRIFICLYLKTFFNL